MLRLTYILLFIFFVSAGNNYCLSQDKEIKDFQIHLKQPAKTIIYLLYEKSFTPIQGELSKDKKSVIIKNYQSGSKVRVKVEYEDGTKEELIKSPCFIDPVIS